MFETVESWVNAWSSQDFESYLRCYSRNFVPRDCDSVRSWKERHWRRVCAPFFVDTSYRCPVLEPRSQGRVAVTFEQLLVSDRYQEDVERTLVMEKRLSRWLIIEDIVLDRSQASSPAPNKTTARSTAEPCPPTELDTRPVKIRVSDLKLDRAREAARGASHLSVLIKTSG